MNTEAIEAHPSELDQVARGGLTDDARFAIAARVRHAARALKPDHPARQPLLDRALLLEIPGPDAPTDEIVGEIARLLR